MFVSVCQRRVSEESWQTPLSGGPISACVCDLHPRGQRQSVVLQPSPPLAFFLGCVILATLTKDGRTSCHSNVILIQKDKQTVILKSLKYVEPSGSVEERLPIFCCRLEGISPFTKLNYQRGDHTTEKTLVVEIGVKKGSCHSLNPYWGLSRWGNCDLRRPWWSPI